MRLLRAMSALLLSQGAIAVMPRATAPCPYHRPSAELIADEYIVVLHDGHTLEKHFEHIGRDLSQNSSMFHPITTINGYRARLTEDLVHEHVRFDPGVEFVEHDHKPERARPTMRRPHEDDDSGAAQTSMVRGLVNRLRNFRRDDKWGWLISSSSKGTWYDVQKSSGKKLDSLSSSKFQAWQTLDGAGKGVNIYILDTGIRLSHRDFQGRAINFGGKEKSTYVYGATANDLDGHGTHVAGIAAGARGGMAPWATIVNVKVKCADKEAVNFECINTSGGVIQAISDVTTEHNANKKKGKEGWKGSVMNLSLFSKDSEAEKKALKAAFKAGIPIAVAAGNENKEVNEGPCTYTESTVCVASSNIKYKKSSFSNYGRQVKIIAPGEEIISASNEHDRMYEVMSGTSMASPFVAGAMAIYVGFEKINNDVKKVHDRLFKNSLTGIISGFPTNPSTANNFVNSGINSVLKAKNVPYHGAVVKRPKV